MKISRQELERLIKEELQEALEQYPADAMAEITATIFSLADQAGVETTGDQREDIVDEINFLLRGQGYQLYEQGLVFADPLNISLNGTYVELLMDDIDDALPGSWDKIINAFAKGGISTDLAPRNNASEPEDDEDLTSTVVTPPVSPPDDEDEEDGTDTVVVPPVDPPPEEPPEVANYELQVGDIIDVGETFGTKASKKHFLHKMLKPGTSYRVTSTDDDEENPLEIANVETDRKIHGLRPADFLDYPEFFTVNPAATEEEEDIPSILSVANFDFDDASEFNKFFLTLDDESMKALIKEVPRRPFTVALMGAEDETKARFYKFISPRAQEFLEDDQKIMRGADGASVGPEDIHRNQQEVLKFARDMGLGEEESFENPWAFKWFWEDGALDDLGDDREDSEVVRNLKSIPTGKEITIGILAGLAGTAGLYALWKYLFGAEDDEDLPPGLAQSVADQAEELEDLSGIDVQDPEFIVSVLKWVLSLTLDEGQMVWVDRLEPIIRVLSQQDITPEALSSLLDEVPGIELIDKLPGGREKVVEVMMDKWDDMSEKERIDLILMLAPEEYLEMLDQVLKASPRMSDIPGMDFPGVKSGLYVWLEDGPVLPPRGDFDPPLWEFLLLAAGRLGLVDGKHVTMAHQIINDLWDSLEESKEDGKVKRGMKLMKMLFQEQQLNRMKVLAGIK